MVQFSQQDVAVTSGDPICHVLDDIRVACLQMAQQLQAKQGWADTDFRIVAIHRVKNICQSTLALYSFRSAIVPRNEYWAAFFARIPVQADLHKFTVELDTMVRFATIQGLFSVLESEMRTIVTRIDPTACKGGKDAFARIYGWLSARIVAIKSFEEFVRLMRLTRNTIHTNGSFYPENATNATVVWKGTTYDFVVGSPLAFVTWNFTTSAARDILDCLGELLNDVTVIGLPS